MHFKNAYLKYSPLVRGEGYMVEKWVRISSSDAQLRLRII